MADEKKEPKSLDIQISELHDAVRKLHEKVDAATLPRPVCAECSCGPCNECVACWPCRVCHACNICRACRICKVCAECSCGPCAE